MTNLETTLHTKLDELITAVKTSAIPLRDRWIDAETAGAMLSVSAYTFRHAYACRPDFPKPLREGHPRWKASEVLEWAERQRNRKAA